MEEREEMGKKRKTSLSKYKNVKAAHVCFFAAIFRTNITHKFFTFLFIITILSARLSFYIQIFTNILLWKNVTYFSKHMQSEIQTIFQSESYPLNCVFYDPTESNVKELFLFLNE